MDTNKVKYLIIALLATVLILSPMLYLMVDKPNIHETTIEELQDINGIGEHYAIDIITYLKINKTACIEDLEDIKGIGPITIEKLKRKYGD